MNLKRPLFKICILTKPGQCRIYGVHDEAKDKAFELELSWICDESKRQHQKVLWDSYEEWSLNICGREFYCTFFLLTCHTGSKWTVGARQGRCSGSFWGDACWLRNTIDRPELVSSFGDFEIFDPFGLMDWTWQKIARFYFECDVKFHRCT
jgi:20S proteasome subunit alpha 7